MDTPKLAENDHRRLGKELDLFVFSDLVGSGLPMYTPRGAVLREQLMAYANQLREEKGFNKVWTPHLTKKELYEASGHWDKFGQELFLVKSQETDDELVLKPMNCPHHAKIYSSQPRSYKDLPLKFLETATVYRDEKSGELQGLARVRSINMDDSHVFCRPDQIEDIVRELIEAAQQLYKTLGMELKFRLSFKDDSDAYLGEQSLWDKAQSTLLKIAKTQKLHFETVLGDAAFYGPKIDFLATDVLKRIWQVATVQLDFNQPKRLGLNYTDEDGRTQVPVMVHCALLGSIERFLAVYLEHTEGRLPLWLAPEQLRIISLNNQKPILKMAEDVVRKSENLGLRAKIDDSDQTVNKKILNAEAMKVPYSIVIGPKEIDTRKVAPRSRGDLAQIPELSIDELLSKLADDAKSRR
ncbi:MAG: threonine--tRNA ligase [Candidatus Saccharimonadales bacterium]